MDKFSVQTLPCIEIPDLETPGMSCVGGKIRLPEINLPPEPLPTLVSGVTSW